MHYRKQADLGTTFNGVILMQTSQSQAKVCRHYVCRSMLAAVLFVCDGIIANFLRKSACDTMRIWSIATPFLSLLAILCVY